MRTAWSGVRLRWVDQAVAAVEYGSSIRVAIAAKLNGLAPEDVVVEIVLARPGARHAGESLERRRLLPMQQRSDSGECVFALEFAPQSCGQIEYRARAYPVHELLSHPFEMGMMLWL